MKLSDTTKLPKKTSAKVNDPDNPAWTEDMLGEPVLKRVQQGQEKVPNERTAKSLLLPDEEKDYQRFDVLVNSRFKDLDAEDLPIPKRMPARFIDFDAT